MVDCSHIPTGIRAPGMDVLKIPLLEPSVVIDGVSVWEWSGSALDEGNEASEWFSNYLGKRSRLVRFNEGTIIKKFAFYIFVKIKCHSELHSFLENKKTLPFSLLMKCLSFSFP